MRRDGRRGRAAALWLLLAGTGLVPASAALAQPAPQAGPRSFTIPAQPLAAALGAFSDATGIQFFFDAAMARGLRSGAVAGSMTPDAALAQMLAGTGLTYRHTNRTTVTLIPAPVPQSGDGAVSLPQIDVETSTERGWSPVRGYAARLSTTATRTDTPLIETPQSISVVTRDQMDDRGARNIADALAYTPGAMTGIMGANSSFGGDSTSVRGFGGNGTAGASFNQFLDGMRMVGTGYAEAGLDPWLLERVETLRGPASVLYGQVLPGGLINLVSRRPTETTQGEIRIGAGTLDRRELAFDTTGPLTADGSLLYRLTGIGIDTDLQPRDTARTRVAIAPALTWRPNADTSLTLLGFYQRDRSDGSPLNYLPAYGTALWNPNGRLPVDFYTGEPRWDRWHRTAYAAGYLLEHRVNDWLTLRNNYRYYHNDLDMRAVFRGSLPADGRTLTRRGFTAVEHSDLHTADLGAELRFATGRASHTLLVGADYQWLQGLSTVGIGDASPLDLFAPVYNRTIPTAVVYDSRRSTTQQLGLYVQDQVRIDRWALQFGLRQDFAVWSDHNRLTGGGTEQSAQALTGRAGLVYLFDFGLAPYASYAESFQPVTGADYGGRSLQPTRGRQYEIGVRYQPPGTSSSVALAWFDLTQTNRTTGDPAHPGFSVQTGEVRIRGLEFEAVASLGGGFGLTAAYTWLDSEVTQSTGVDLGKQLHALPRHMASLWASQTWQQGPLGGLMLGAGLRYVGRSYGDPANSFSVRSHTLVDAALRYDLGRVLPRADGVSVNVTANNLFDTRYVASCSRDTTCYWGTGRSVQVALNYRW
ncbi:TonB-dependent siderophore receptor [Plastoroseomonas hellenica]|uniref:TonB-dependent siderophore receptor n=1 Tax=Plastoroseomonas hellenica TaxID=2687306 RepID=UPI001BA7A518|nr:TonB-dependent siderophore receptor [Plastoroseomonas hellenica]MBR0643055.1 TonB-dependent siderophore receptor [Plastoroseomonas hellenica]